MVVYDGCRRPQRMPVITNSQLPQDYSQSDALRHSLSNSVLAFDRNPFESLEKTSADSATALTELLRKANAEGMNTKIILGE
jgi:hypothetical protein